MNDFIKDLLVTTYGAVLAVALQELVDWLKKRPGGSVSGSQLKGGPLARAGHHIES